MSKTIATLALLCALLPSSARTETLQEGAAFPAWKLRDHTGSEVDSSSLRGTPYLLWYYPKAMTPGCTAEGIGLRDRHDEFRALGVAILGVSFDAPEENARFVAAHGFPFRLLSDDGSLAVLVGAAESSDQRVPRRLSYLVGADGRVLRRYDTVTPAEHAADVLAHLRELPAPTP